jgi:hypothetical protein
VGKTKTKENMAQKANQHYVPQFYFRYFSANGKSICVLNRSTGLMNNSASIKGQASKKYFYGESEVESRLAEIDGLFSGAVREIKKNGSFENCLPHNYVLLLQNIMLQKSRTVSERKKTKAMQDKLLQLHLECEVHNDESLDEKTKEEFKKHIKSLEANPKQYQPMAMKVAIECAEHLLGLRPIVLHNKTNRPFIFGDAPVIFTNPLLKQIRLRGVLGAQTPGIIVLYPLSSNQCVMLIDERSYKINKFRSSDYRIRELSDVAQINKLQIHNAASAIYFSDFKYSRYVAELWRQEQEKLVDHKGKIVEAPGYYHNGEALGDILHSFEEQLPLVPKLSFLKYVEVPEREYQFSRRKDYV